MSISFPNYDDSSLLSVSFMVLLGLGILRIIQLYMKWILSPLRNVPGPKLDSFLLGYFPMIRKEPFMEPHKRWWKDVGYDVPMMHYTGILGASFLVVLDKDIIKEILTAKNGVKKPRFVKFNSAGFLKNILGEGLVTVEGENWSIHRQIIQPAFHTNFLKQALIQSVPHRVEQLVQYWTSATVSSSGREIDLASHLSALTLDIIGDVAFSHDFTGLKSVQRWVEKCKGTSSSTQQQDSAAPDDNEQLEPVDDPFIKALSDMFKFNPLTTLLFIIGSPLLARTVNPRTRRLRKHLDHAVDEIVNNARNLNTLEKQQQENETESPVQLLKAKSLLRLLLQANDNDNNNNNSTMKKARALNIQELRDETKTFIIAGHETTSTLCYFAIYALMTHPHIQERLHKELSQVNINTNEKYDLLKLMDELEYFNAFLNEVARLYPPVGMMMRVNQFEEKFGGQTIPKNTRLVIPIHLLHRHPKYWKNPEEFQPERWMNPDDNFLKQTRFAYIPFSTGGRNCIGQKFALIEAKLILFSLLRAFEFKTAPSQQDTKFTFTNLVTMKTKPGLKVCVKARK